MPPVSPILNTSFGTPLELLVGKDFAQVEAYNTNEGINLADVPTLIMVLEMAFGETDHVVTAERKLEMLKQTNCDFSIYYSILCH
jgi:uncharacterized protein YpmB